MSIINENGPNLLSNLVCRQISSGTSCWTIIINRFQQSKMDQTIAFNMLYFISNYMSGPCHKWQEVNYYLKSCEKFDLNEWKLRDNIFSHLGTFYQQKGMWDAGIIFIGATTFYISPSLRQKIETVKFLNPRYLFQI